MNTNKYVGVVGTVPQAEKANRYGFINILTVTTESGDDHEIATDADIFIHQDECSPELRPGLKLIFTVSEDSKRGEGHFRAFGAEELIEPELISGEMMEFRNTSIQLITPEEMRVERLPIHRKMKDIEPEVVEQVIINRPLPTVQRSGAGTTEQDALLAAFLRYLFPSFESFGTDYDVVNKDDAALEEALKKVSDDLSEFGMRDQLARFKEEIDRFKSMRAALGFIRSEGLVRTDTIIPIKYLPDFFMAVPVWFFWTANDTSGLIMEEDPLVQPQTKYFCDLFPNIRWAHTFQMFNRRTRSFRAYKGDLIPPHVSRRMKAAIKMFDYVVIMTPYLDLAGADWQDDKWLRSLDPYVVGFKKGISYFFVLARFSDSGTFPLFNELMADTINYLSTNVELLKGFNKVEKPYWYVPNHLVDDKNFGKHPHNDCTWARKLGSVLEDHAHELLEAFERGKLFDWLRGEDDGAIEAIT